MSDGQKTKARIEAYKAFLRGDIIRKPCEVCGNAEVEMHHDDYEKPFDVRFLCRPHHAEHHHRLRKHMAVNLRHLMAWVDRGDVSRIGRSLGLSPYQAFTVIDGQRYCPQFVRQFMRIVNRNKAAIT